VTCRTGHVTGALQTDLDSSALPVDGNYLADVVGQWCDLRVDLDLKSLPADREDHLRARRGVTPVMTGRNDDGLFGHRS
jgi:hypothetical protein